MVFLNKEQDLDISIPITKLTPGQFAQCQDPWDGFTLEEEYYILYDSISAMTHELVKAEKMAAISDAVEIIGGDDIELLRDTGFQAVCLASWFSHRVAGVPKLVEKQLIQPSSSLNANKLAWGRAIHRYIATNAVLTSVWAFRLDELCTRVAEGMDFCARAEAKLFGTSENLFEVHLERARAGAEKAVHRRVILASIKKKWIPKWANGEYDTSNDIRTITAEYIEKHKEELRFFIQRKKVINNRVKNLVEADPTYQKHIEDMRNKPKSSIFKILSDFGVDSDQLDVALAESNCGNPDCPTHGEFVRKEQRTQVDTLSTTVTKKTEGSNNIMAIDKNIKKVVPGSEALKFTNVGVQFVDDPNSRSIHLPVGMTYEEGRYWLTKMEGEENRTFQFDFKFTGWAIMDAMWAVYQAAVELHGFAHIADEQHNGFFGSWLTPPKLITIPVGPHETKQIPWGPIEVNGISAKLNPEIVMAAGHFALQFSSEIKNNERQTADKLMRLALEILAARSIYRGKAIEMDFAVMQLGNFASFDPQKAPKFMDLGDPEIEELVLSNSIQRLVDVTVWTPIRKTELAEKHKIPLRRTITLAGPHGVGKTLTALATAKIAVQHGWTFLYLRNLNQIIEALYFAQKYQPCIVFAEDVDTLVGGDRDEKMNKVFNVVDGIDRKGDKVMLIFSTNNLKDIHHGMLRPGRTDTVIPFAPPDSEAVGRLLRIYGRGLIDPSADLAVVAQKMAGQIPAIIREAVERSKLAAMADHHGDGELVVRADHLDTAADQMLIHAELLKEPDEERPDLEVFGEALGQVIVQGMRYYRKEDGADLSKEEVAEAKGNLRGILEDSRLGTNGKHPVEL